MIKKKKGIVIRLIAFALALVLTATPILTTVQEVNALVLWNQASKEQKAVANFMYSYLTSKKGLSNQVALGIIANASRETGWNPDADDLDNCYGVFSWINGRAKGVKKAQKGKKGDNKLKAQLDYAIDEADKDTPWKSNSSNPGNIDTTEKKNKVHLKKIKSYDEFKKVSGYEAATLWCVCWERSADMYSDCKKNIECYDTIAGKITGSSTSVEGTGGLSTVTPEDFTIIGDSRVVGLVNTVDSVKSSTGGQIAHVGTNVSFLQKIIKNELKDCGGCIGNASDTSNHVGGYKLETSQVIIWMGTNDLVNIDKGSSQAYDGKMNNLLKNYQTCVKQLQQAGKQVTWVSCGNVWEGGSLAKNGKLKNTCIKRFNNKMRAWCESNDTTYVAINGVPELKSKKNKLSGDKKSDGVHYTGDVYSKVWDKVSAAEQKIIADSVESASSSSESGGENAGTVKTIGALDEEYFGVYGTQLKENAISLPNADMLTVNEKKQLATWGNNIETTDEHYISFFRRVVSFVGIMITVYCLFIYLAYWLDRVNNFFDISLLNMLTLGNLELSPDEKQSTFEPTTQGRKLVNHKDVIKIVFIGCTVGVLLISGWIYKWIGMVMGLIKRLMGTL